MIHLRLIDKYHIDEFNVEVGISNPDTLCPLNCPYFFSSS